VAVTPMDSMNPGISQTGSNEEVWGTQFPKS